MDADASIARSPRDSSSGEGRLTDGVVGFDWDLCSVCEKPFTVVRERLIRPHGHPARRCPGSHVVGIYRSDRERHPSPSASPQGVVGDGLGRDQFPRCMTCKEPLNIYGGWWSDGDHDYVSLSAPVWRCPKGHEPQTHALPPLASSSDEPPAPST